MLTKGIIGFGCIKVNLVDLCRKIKIYSNILILVCTTTANVYNCSRFLIPIDESWQRLQLCLFQIAIMLEQAGNGPPLFVNVPTRLPCRGLRFSVGDKIIP